MKTLTILATSAVFMVSCSTQPRDSKAPEDSKAVAEAAELDQSLPAVTMVRVPLDENGNEDVSKAEFRVLDQELVEGDDEQLADAFEQGQTADALSSLDELDSDSSSQSWYFARTQGPADVGNPYTTDYQTNHPHRQLQDRQARVPCDSTRYDCGETQEHVRGNNRAIYPVKRKRVYQHNTTDVYPQERVDVYPVEHVRVHPTQRQVRVHPAMQQVSYVGGQSSCYVTYNRHRCGRFGGYMPTVRYRGYHQFYHHRRNFRCRGHRYYQYVRPAIYRRYGQGGRW